MEVRNLRYFVAVADSLSFSKAAREMHVSQPPLSRRIADLEAELGTRLFERTTKKVRLTAAGEALLPYARTVLQASEAGVHAVRLAAGQSQPMRLRIGLPLDTSSETQLELLKRIGAANIDAELIPQPVIAQLKLLAEGDLDIGVMRHPFDSHALKIVESFREPLGVVMRIDHPLAKREKIRLSELHSYPLLCFLRSVLPATYDEILQSCRSAGYVPPRVLHGERMSVAMATEADVVGFDVRWRLDQAGENFVWKPLEGDPLSLTISAVCRPQEWDEFKRVAIDIVLTALREEYEALTSGQ